MEFSRQEYWNRRPLPSPEDLPNPGIKPMSLASPALADRFFNTSTSWEAHVDMDTYFSISSLVVGNIL